MKYDHVKKTVIECIRVETDFNGPISEDSRAVDIDGWDSIGHVRIVYRIELIMGVNLERDLIYSSSTVGDLIEIVIGAMEGL
jgi:acyl carrier protein